MIALVIDFRVIVKSAVPESAMATLTYSWESCLLDDEACNDNRKK